MLLLRTAALAVVLAAALAACGTAPAPPAPVRKPELITADNATNTALAALENRDGARVGVFAVDTGTGRTYGYRADERFAYDSTYKSLIAGVLLHQDTPAQLAHVVTYTSAELQTHSPVTSAHLATGMSVSDLIAAAVDYSDNTAANLLLDQLGGPAGLQRGLRVFGDTTTNADRTEPDVNAATPGDIRDTSTPRAMATDLRGLALGNWLTPAQRTQMVTWLDANTTGATFIKAGTPAGWRVGDRTGNGYWGTFNDIAVLWPPTGSPIVLAVFTARHTPEARSTDDDLIADTARAVLANLH
jgi:beta-lactamase class A